LIEMKREFLCVATFGKESGAVELKMVGGWGHV
jgi:hypothetical protein